MKTRHEIRHSALGQKLTASKTRFGICHDRNIEATGTKKRKEKDSEKKVLRGELRVESVGMDVQLTHPLLDPLPDDPRHLVPVHLHHGVRQLDPLLVGVCGPAWQVDSFQSQSGRLQREKRNKMYDYVWSLSSSTCS